MINADRFRKMLVDLGLDTTAAAQELKIERSYISALQSGRQRPGLGLAARIESLSRRWRGGLILATDWAPTEAPARAKRATPKKRAA